jgi:hypothetical protein
MKIAKRIPREYPDEDNDAQEDQDMDTDIA